MKSAKGPDMKLSDPLVQVWLRRSTKDKIIRLGLGTMDYTVQKLLEAYKHEKKAKDK